MSLSLTSAWGGGKSKTSEDQARREVHSQKLQFGKAGEQSRAISKGPTPQTETEDRNLKMQNQKNKGACSKIPRPAEHIPPFAEDFCIPLPSLAFLCYS